MFLRLLALFLCAHIAFVRAQSTISYTPIPTLPSAISVGPTLVPTLEDPTASDSQVDCPGYRADNVQLSDVGITADLILNGPACNTYGTDIEALSLLVEYQSKQRLHVQIMPKYLSPANMSHYFLSPSISEYPGIDHGFKQSDGADLAFNWKNTPSFQFEITRSNTGDVIFTTYGHKVVYQDQFIEIATSMLPDYNAYGLAENIGNFRLGTNYTQVYWNCDNGNTIDENVYGTHPLYVENRYGNDTSSAHGVYARNAHAQEWLLRDDNITYRTLGGALDLYFLSGPTPKDVVAQYQGGIIGYPQMQMYWTFGYHQCRWGYENWTVMQDLVDNFRAADIPLETVWNDIDYMEEYRDFTTGHLNFPLPAGQSFLSRLHANNQHYVPIVDSNIYAPDPTNASDVYDVFERGSSTGAFIRNGDLGFFYGVNWPGFSVWPDFLTPQGQDFWTHELSNWYHDIPYDGIWIDLSEFASYAYGSVGTGQLEVNPAHPPFKLPGDPGNVIYDYPEDFNATNSTAAASASSASASQASSTSAMPSPTGPSFGRTMPTPGVRNLNLPPYTINNVKAGHALGEFTISPNATHNDQYNTTQYDVHNVNGHLILRATHDALLKVFPGRRPFVLGRSTFAGSGTIGSHWGGDNTSKWGSMYLSIAQAFTFMIASIPMFGADTCGFTGNTDAELCTRWMELSAFFPFYRNHNEINTIPQEPYTWATTASATRTVMQIRYSLLPYIYTLFYLAHTQGSMPMRPLQFEFPDEEYLRGVDNQFLLGPSILVTPALLPQVMEVKGVFPGTGGPEGVIWYDWYTLQPEQVLPKENKTLAAPLEKINVHIRGGSILPLQQPGYTTTESRRNPWSLLITLDANESASGYLYLDDGESVSPKDTKEVSFTYGKDKLTAAVEGGYVDTNPLVNVTVAGVKRDGKPRSVVVNGRECFGKRGVEVDFANGVLNLSGLKGVTKKGAWLGKKLTVEFGY